jgi:hypothetical protein
MTTALYVGNTSLLHTLPGDNLVVQPSRLAVLTRSYACANSQAAAARLTLVPGSNPYPGPSFATDYPNLFLFRKPSEAATGPITTFQCQYYGVLNPSDYYQLYTVNSTEVRSLTGQTLFSSGIGLPTYTPFTAKYLAPVITQTFVRPTASALQYSTPTLSVAKALLSEIFVTVPAITGTSQQSTTLNGTSPSVPLTVSTVSIAEVNYGTVTETQLKFTGIAPPNPIVF